MADRVEIGDATLYHGDCLEILPTLPKVDAVVTDPPYGQAYVAPAATGKHGNLKSAPPAVRSTADRIAGDTRPFDPEPLIRLAPEVLLWGAHKFSDRLPAGQWLVWDKKPDGTRNDFGDGEAAWLNKAGALRIFRHLWNGLAVQSGSEEAMRQGRSGAQVQRLHPTQKPVALMSWCLSFIKGHTVLDPYMGSGTTGVACANLGRKFIGIEIERKYFDIACERIAAAYAQGRLFA